MSDLVETVARAWLRHQGYTDDDIADAPKSHREAGCDSEGFAYNCWDERGQSLHPVWDAIVVAGEMANVAVEALGLSVDLPGDLRRLIDRIPSAAMVPKHELVNLLERTKSGPTDA
jgi:hypothetical protein